MLEVLAKFRQDWIVAAMVSRGSKIFRIFEKVKKTKKIEIWKNCIKFYEKFEIKSIVFEQKFISVTRRAGCSILGSKSNTGLKMF